MIPEVGSQWGFTALNGLFIVFTVIDYDIDAFDCHISYDNEGYPITEVIPMANWQHHFIKINELTKALYL